MTPALISLADLLVRLDVKRKAVMRLIALGKLRGLRVLRRVARWAGSCRLACERGGGCS